MNESFNNGEAEGLAEGEAKGKEEERMRVARNLLKLGYPLSHISAATGFSEEQLSNLL